MNKSKSRYNLIWNEIPKKKLECLLKYFKIYNFNMDINITLYILKKFMKPDIYDIVNKKISFANNFPIYFGCEKIFPSEINVELTRCNGCNARTGTNDDNDIIKLKNIYYNLCDCGKNYCRECYIEYFLKQNICDNRYICRGCYNIINPDDIKENYSGILPYDLSKLKFIFNISKYILYITFYIEKDNVMYGQQKVYDINLNLSNLNKEKNNIEFNINNLQKKIINLNKYYRKKKIRKLIVFSKFYNFLNELLFFFCKPFPEKYNLSKFDSMIKTYNKSYKNPKRMLELFIVFESINKYYNKNIM